jgi:hypothetical protein
MRLRQAELTILIRGSKGEENSQNNHLVRNLAWKRNPDKGASQKDSMMVTRYE